MGPDRGLVHLVGVAISVHVFAAVLITAVAGVEHEEGFNLEHRKIILDLHLSSTQKEITDSEAVEVIVVVEILVKGKFKVFIILSARVIFRGARGMGRGGRGRGGQW